MASIVLPGHFCVINSQVNYYVEMPPKQQPGPKPGSKRFRNWMFTYYPKPDSTWTPESCFERSEWILFLCGQFERCPETGRRHFQGYLHGRSSLGLKSVQREIGLPGCHLAVRRGTHEEAVDYCTKEESREPGEVPYVLGDAPQQGARNDLAAVRKVLDDQRSLRGAFDFDFVATCKYYRAFERYLGTCGEPRDPDDAPEVHYYWGEPGTGKTKEAYRIAQDRGTQVYPVPISGKDRWFNGYQPGYHGVILLDDYFQNWSSTFFLQFIDRYPMQLPTKGGFVDMGKALIIITSNIPLGEQYPQYPTQEAITRRFTLVKHFGKIGVTAVCPSAKRQKTK